MRWAFDTFFLALYTVISLLTLYGRFSWIVSKNMTPNKFQIRCYVKTQAERKKEQTHGIKVGCCLGFVRGT